MSSIKHVRSNLVAYLALFLALGGTSYAAATLPAGSVGAKQLTKGSVTSTKVKNGSLLRRDFKRGQLRPAVGPQGPQGLPGPAGPKGEKGDPGPAATKLFAKVSHTGGLTYGSGATGVVRPETGHYLVLFDRSLVGCVAIGTVGHGNPGVSGDSVVVRTHLITHVARAGVGENVVEVKIFDTTASGGTQLDSAFHLAVLC